MSCAICNNKLVSSEYANDLDQTIENAKPLAGSCLIEALTGGIFISFFLYLLKHLYYSVISKTYYHIKYKNQNDFIDDEFFWCSNCGNYHLFCNKCKIFFPIGLKSPIEGKTYKCPQCGNRILFDGTPGNFFSDMDYIPPMV